MPLSRHIRMASISVFLSYPGIMRRGKENGTEIYGLEDRLPRQGGLIQSYNEILRDYDKT